MPRSLNAAGFIILLQLITEDRMAAGADADGSATTGRALQLLGGWDRMTPGRGVRGRRRLRELILQAEPILARTARVTPPS
jgi:hypothetical protein